MSKANQLSQSYSSPRVFSNTTEIQASRATSGRILELSSGTRYQVSPVDLGSGLLMVSGLYANQLSVSSTLFSSVKDLGTAVVSDGELYSIVGFYASTKVGGGDFTFSASEDKANHNGGSIIDPDRALAWDGTQADLSTYFAVGAGAGCFVRASQDNLQYDVFWWGADESASSNTISFNAAFLAAASDGHKGVIAEGQFNFETDLLLREGVICQPPSGKPNDLVMVVHGCKITNEIIDGKNPACRDTGLTATIDPGIGTELIGVELAGCQYSTFRLIINDFDTVGATGLLITSRQDAGLNWRYSANNTFYELEVSGCYNGIHLTKSPSDPATFGSNFNQFVSGYINGYTSVGVFIEFGEANSFNQTRATTSITGSTGWVVEDSVNLFNGTTADGSFGGTAPGAANVWGFPFGLDGDLTSVGMRFNDGSTGSVVVNPRGNATYNRFDFDSQTTLDNITIIGRVDFNWIPKGRLKEQVMVSDSSSNAPVSTHTSTVSSAVVAEFSTDATTNPTIIKILSNGAAEIGSGDNDVKFIAGNVAVGRFSSGSGNFIPETDNTQNNGTASARWDTIFAGTGAINTSDEREKQDIALLSAAESRVAQAIKQLIKSFRFTQAVNEKGDNARIHFGIMAQDLIGAFSAEGLDANRYSMFCYDEWPSSTSDGGELIPAGNRYGVRYEELLCFMLSAM